LYSRDRLNKDRTIKNEEVQISSADSQRPTWSFTRKEGGWREREKQKLEKFGTDSSQPR